jgi:DNA-binding response OmpR family regulator
LIANVTANRATALLIDDDAKLASLLVEYLGQNDVQVTVAADGEAGLRRLKAAPFDVVLLDLMLPGIDGLEVCKRIRGTKELERVPVLMLTAKGDDVDRIVGLELGADDYLPKPFNPRELLARVRALLRRASSVAAEGERLRIGELEIDLGARTVAVEGRRPTLTSFEFELLVCLARSAGRVLSRDYLMEALKSEAFESFDRKIDVHISKLRAKLEKDPKSPRYIKTVRGVGYVLARE